MRLDYTKPYSQVQARLLWLQTRHYKNDVGTNKEAFNKLRQKLAEIEQDIGNAWHDMWYARLIADRSKRNMQERTKIKPVTFGYIFPEYTGDFEQIRVNGVLHNIRY